MINPDPSYRDPEKPSGEVMNALLRKLFAETQGMAIHGCMADGTVVYWNQGAETLFGFTATEAIGRTLFDLIIPSAMCAPFAHTVRAMVESGHGAAAARQLLQHKNGHPVAVHTTHSVVEAPGDRPVLFCMHADMTELARAEAALRDQEEDYRAMVQDLRRAQEEAQKANRDKSSFLAAASHDLRQPLYALSLYAEALRPRLGADGAALAADIRHCIDGLSGLLTDLFDLSKLQAGVVIPNVSDFEVDPLLSKLASTYRPQALSKNIELRTRPTNLTARTDPVLLNRIVGNLVSNAVRFTQRGSILIACRRYQGKDWIEVWDTGSGIPEDKQHEIFDTFVHFEDGDQSAERGSGLGLSIVAGSADLLGLQLRIRSRVGRGSMFAIEIPRAADARFDLPPTGKEARPVRIGLVDDNIAALRTLSSALTRLGHQVVAAKSSQDLLARIDPSEPPEVVIVDVRLDGRESGYEAVVALRAAFGAELAAIIVTADTNPQVMHEMAERKVLVLHQPLELGALQAAIGRLEIKPA